jgi:hypothetical protein
MEGEIPSHHANRSRSPKSARICLTGNHSWPPGALPQLTLYNGSLLNGVVTVAPPPSSILDSFFAFPTAFGGGVRVGFSAGFGSSSGHGAVLAGEGPGAGSVVAPFDAVTFAALTTFAPFGLFNGGVFVAG